jgi:hypothetical protein
MLWNLKSWRAGLAIVAAALVAACGSGSDAGCSVFGCTSGGPSGGPVAAGLDIVLSKTSVGNSGSETVTATVTAVDASRNGLSGIPVTISVDNNAVAIVGGTATNAGGQLTATVQIGSDKTNRVITVAATSGTLVRSAAFAVTGAKLNASVQTPVVAPGASGAIKYRLVDVNAVAMVNIPIIASATGIAQGSGVTDANGEFAYAFTAPATAGPLNFTATAGGATADPHTVLVQSGPGAIPAVTAPIVSASIAANPSVVAVNTATTNNRTELRARFVGPANAAVANVRVKFDLAGDVNTVGGTFDSGTTVVYSDANGIATTSYSPGSRSSPTNGVTIRACYYNDDASAAAGGCANFATNTLTVTSEPLAVSIGTNNVIEIGASGLTFVKRYVVLVVDASGQAKSDVQITPSVDLLSYVKGFYEWNGKVWTRTQLIPPVGFLGPTCPNEDINRNAVLEAGEDTNGNASLDPRKSDVAISVLGNGKTDASGTAVVRIEYPQNVATWVNFQILVAAGGVAGTEGRATWTDQLPAVGSQFTTETPAPAFVVSPYGVAATCANPN